MIIHSLKTNHMRNPLGYCFDYLLFSWKVEGTDALTDNWTRIRIAEDCEMAQIVFDSGKIEHLGEPFYYADFNPEPEKRYFWRVEVESDKGEYAGSKTEWFETALMKMQWPAGWIGVKQEGETVPCIYRRFELASDVSSARLYCCGLGLYECFVNNRKAGDEFLSPGYHSYDFNLQYQTFDITDLLQRGSNEISFWLGEGWYKGRFVFEGGYKNLYGDRKAVTAVLKVTYTDGRTETICTENDWKAEETEIRSDGIYDGEVIDRTEPGRVLEVERISASLGLPVARYDIPIKKAASYSVKQIIKTPAGSIVLDFGETITGWVEVHCSGWQDFRLQYGEVMQNGEFYRENLRTAKAEFCFRGKAEDEWVRPHFTYYGFRYVLVEGLEEIRSQDFVAYRLMSDMEVTGRLTTGNPKLNVLIDNALRSQKCNFVGVPLDCPQRDERMGWTGDIGVYGRTACFFMDTAAFLNHYLVNMRMEQKALDGAVPFFVPTPKPKPHEGINPFLVSAGACAWGDASAILPWELYLHYRDVKMLESHYPMMCDWVKYIQGRTQEGKTSHLWKGDRQLGDWLALDSGNPQNPIGKTDTGLIASVYYYYSTVLCAKAAQILGRQEDGRMWQKQAGQIKEEIIREYLNEEGDLICTQTQTAYALLLYFGLYESGRKKILENGLMKMLEQYQHHLSTGFVGTAFLMPALSENGMCDEAYTLLLQEDYPSWLREVNLGATTIWERWNSINDDGSINKDGMNSLNHYCYGCVVGWMFETMCGFRWNEQGRLYIEPHPDKRVEKAEGEYETVYGKFKVKWSYEENENIRMEIVVPFQAKAAVLLPWGEQKEMEAGRYVFSGSV